jgi:LPS-assembly protein
VPSPDLPRARARRRPLVVWASLLASTAFAQPAPALQPVPALQPPPGGSDVRGQAPVYLRADRLAGQLQATVAAQGAVELRHAGIVLRADELRYDLAEDLAVAEGRVRISFDGSVVRSPKVELKVQRVEGFARQPEYRIALTGAGGTAERIDFLGSGQARVTRADYTACTREDGQQPDWLIRADTLHLDQDAGVGVADDAELLFFGWPVLVLPSLSFPLNDQRKSGWLAPTLDLSTGSGLEFAVPYYWDIAPNRDATLTPAISTRRGFAVAGEFRYLEPAFAGQAMLDLLPYDRVAERTRWWTTWAHEGRLRPDTLYALNLERVSDDDWWNDFPRRHQALTPRLLPLDAEVVHDLRRGDHALEAYARTRRWQLLQAPNVIDAPFDRSLQLGVRSLGNLPVGLQYAIEAEANRFELPSNPGYVAPQTPPGDGSRLHAQGWLSRPWREPGWWIAPSVLFNAAAYYTDEPMAAGDTRASRVIPTASVGAGAEFERQAEFFGRALRQTLEPRLLYVYTPYVAQAGFPNFDSAIKDFSFASIYSENAFSGIDRVSDSNALTAGVSTRLIDAASGEELLQLGIVQRYLFQNQLITDSGLPEQRGYSDVLLRGATRVLQPLNLEAYLRWSPNSNEFERAILGLQYAPAPFRTLNLTYRYAREVTSQYELSWQWPIYEPDGQRPPPNANASCRSAWYTVGRLNYNNRDSRLTDSVVGIEYDAGCWIARLAVSRWSTGASEANTQVVLQLELVGLSRVGSNALSLLRDNIPGYRLLREGRSATPASAFYD